MIRKKTVFILGAGASVPYGFPTGEGLLARICEKLSTQIQELFEKTTGLDRMKYEDLLPASEELGQKIVSLKPESIDILVSRWPSLERIGKYAILINILEAEKQSNFDGGKGDDLYTRLFRLLTDEITQPNEIDCFKENKATFVTFNYDRSLEHRLHDLFMGFVEGVHEQKLNELFSTMPVYHVYDKAENLPWEAPRKTVEFGPDYTLGYLDTMSANIQAIYGDRHIAQAEEISAALSSAKRVFFLGFGYHPFNPGVLGVPDILKENTPEVYGTAIQVSEERLKELKQGFSFVLKVKGVVGAKNTVSLEPVDCSELIEMQG